MVGGRDDQAPCFLAGGFLSVVELGVDGDRGYQLD